MSVAIPPLLQYAIMAWCLVKAQEKLYLYTKIRELEFHNSFFQEMLATIRVRNLNPTVSRENVNIKIRLILPVLLLYSGFFEHRNEPLGFIKGGEFCDWLSDCQLLKESCAPWSYFIILK
jgi:hypothetical protein